MCVKYSLKFLNPTFLSNSTLNLLYINQSF